MSQARRVFTLEQANKTLPFVRRVVKDIVESHHQICDLYTRWRKLCDDGCAVQAEELEMEIRALLEDKDVFLSELEQIGCEFKDMQRGLVDFPATLGDRLVYLCWRLDESEVLFWHEISAGFAGRKSVDGFFKSNGAEHECKTPQPCESGSCHHDTPGDTPHGGAGDKNHEDDTRDDAIDSAIDSAIW